MNQHNGVDLRKLVAGLGRGERLVAAGSLVLLVSAFLNWVSVSCDGPLCGASGGGASGFHGWGWLTFLALCGVVGLLAVRNLPRDLVRVPELPASDSVIVTVLGALEVAGCLLFWVEYHGAFGSGGFVSVGLGIGWFVAVAAGLATAAGGRLMDTGETAEHPLRSEQPVPRPAAEPRSETRPVRSVPPAPPAEDASWQRLLRGR